MFLAFGLLASRYEGLCSGLRASGHERLCFMHERLCFLFLDSIPLDIRVYVTGIRASWHERLRF